MSIRRCYKNPTILFFTAAGLGAFGFGLLQVAHLLPTTGSVYSTLFIGFYFSVAFPAFNAVLAAKNYKHSALTSRHITYTFSDDGLEVEGALLEWPSIVRKQRVGKYLLLFTDRVSAFIIPGHTLSAEQLEFIRSKVPPGRI